MTDQAGTATYTYDEDDRVVSLTRPNGTSTLYGYDETGSVVSVTNMTSDGVLVSEFVYTYDEAGLIASESQSWVDDQGVERVDRVFSYDQDQRLVSYTQSSPRSVDPVDLLVPVASTEAMILPEAPVVEPVGDTQVETVSYTYDGAGNRVEATRTLSGGVTVEQTSYVYDEDDHLVSADSTLTGVTTYTYNPEGSLTGAVNTDTGVVSYEWTAAQRLEAVRAGGTLLMAVSYDGDGNKVFQVEARPVDSSAVFVKTGGSVFSWRDDDLLSSWGGVFWYGFTQGVAQQVGGLNGGLSVAVMADLADGFARVQIRIPSDTDLDQQDVDSLSQAGVTPGDVQDLVESLTASTVLPSTTATSHGYTWDLTHYVNDVNTSTTQVLAEYGPSGTLTADYTYGVGRVDIRATGSSPTTRWLTDSGSSVGWYLPDGRGSAVQVTGMSGSVVQSTSYDPWGVPSSRVGGTASSVFGWNSEEYSAVTGLQYLRARWMEPTSGRFLSQDTWLGQPSQPLSWNRYGYTWGDPVNHVDPSGHMLQVVNEPASKSGSPSRTMVRKSPPVVSVPVGHSGGGQVVQPSTPWVPPAQVNPSVSTVSNSVGTATQTAQTVQAKVKQASPADIAAAQQAYRSTPGYVAQRTAEIRQHVVDFACGTAVHQSDGWRSTIPTTAGLACIGCGTGPQPMFAFALPFELLVLVEFLLAFGFAVLVVAVWHELNPDATVDAQRFADWVAAKLGDLYDEYLEYVDSHTVAEPSSSPGTAPQPQPSPEAGGSGGKPPIKPPTGIPDPWPNDPTEDPSDWPTQDQQHPNCEEVAREIQQRIGGDIYRITPEGGPRLGPSTYDPEGGWYHHEVVVKNGMVYDGTTGPGGMTIADYKTMFEYADAINWGF